jgi:predicted HTH domain antitoxin
MTTLHIDLEDELVALLRSGNQPLDVAAREMIVMELYRCGSISSGKAAELLGISRVVFIDRASRAGIPYLDMTPDEWRDEFERSKRR